MARKNIGKTSATRKAADDASARKAQASETATGDSVFSTLNALLSRAVERQAKAVGAQSLLDPWRGMHLDAADVRAAIGAPPGNAIDTGDDDAATLIARRALAEPRLARVAALLRASPQELATIVFLLAPDVDLRYERIYAYLQDDISRKRPTLDLIARLLCRDVEARLAFLRRFDSTAPLVHAGVVEWHGALDAPLIARSMSLDPLWRNFLLARNELEPQLAPYARLGGASSAGIDSALIDASVRARVAEIVGESAEDGGFGVKLVLAGPHGAGKAQLSAALAHDLGLRMLVLDVRDAPGPSELRALVERAARASVLHDALLCVHGVSRLAPREPQLLRAFADALAAIPPRYVIWLSDELPQLHAIPIVAARVDLELPRPSARAAAWRAALAAHGLEFDATDIHTIADRFKLSFAQIAQAASDVMLVNRGKTPRVGERDLALASRMLCGSELARLAQRIAPQATFDSLVTTQELGGQLREIRDRVAQRETVRERWTGGSVHARCAGVTALFAGPSGTGKTIAAEAIAYELGYDLFRIDLSAVVSKYIGETEKNLDRVFSAAENANAVLLFDEADALFGKRSEVKDAHDRYANIEIAYLLQKMEQFDGLAILATNLKQNLDEAFARRLTFTLNFAFPEVSERERLWAALWPPRVARADDVDLSWFAHQYPLSGGNIRNTVLAAVHLAAGDGRIVTRAHLLHATRREFQKLGKNLALPLRDGQRIAS
jgi:hypothetical protein